MSDFIVADGKRKRHAVAATSAGADQSTQRDVAAPSLSCVYLCFALHTVSIEIDVSKLSSARFVGGTCTR